MLRLGSLILRNVWRNRRRTILTLASTAVSLALLALVAALYQGFFYREDTSPSEVLRLICRHRVSLTQSLPASHYQKIKAVPGVEQVSSWTWFGGMYKEPKYNNFARFAADADVIFDVRKDWSLPPEQLAAFKRERTACVVPEKIARDYNIKLGDRMVIKGDIYPVTLELVVAGIFSHPKNTEALVFHRDYLVELRTTSPNKDSVGMYAILASSADEVPRIAKAIDTMFENSPFPTRTESEKEFGRSFLAFLGNVKMFLMAICGAVTFTILLVSANTVAMAVRERTREVAILRTLGYAPGEILQLVLGEAVVISLLGGLVGLGMGTALAKGLAMQPGSFGFLEIKWQAAVFVLAIAALIGIVAALVPAMIAARKNVVEALRFTG